MLLFYKLDSQSSTFVPYSASDDDDPESNPITTSHNGSDGQSVVKQLFLRNDDSTKYYDSISIGFDPEDLAAPANTTGITYKLLSGSQQPTTAEWSARTSGTLIESTDDIAGSVPARHYIPEIGSSTEADLNYYPIWLQISVPSKTSARAETRVSVSIDFEEHSVE